MTTAPAILGLLASVAGFVSVYYWWNASRAGPVHIPADMTPKGGDGDLWINYGGKETMLLNFAEQSRLNALAAAWTGASVLLQAIAVVVQLSISK